MKVRLLKRWEGRRPHTEHDIDDRLARVLVAQGKAVFLEEPAPDAAEAETPRPRRITRKTKAS